MTYIVTFTFGSSTGREIYELKRHAMAAAKRAAARGADTVAVEKAA